MIDPKTEQLTDHAPPTPDFMVPPSPKEEAKTSRTLMTGAALVALLAFIFAYYVFFRKDTNNNVVPYQNPFESDSPAPTYANPFD
jgi:hypothetical protein